jgi:hypothetical protein
METPSQQQIGQSRGRPDALHEQVCTHASCNIHLLSRRRVDPLPGPRGSRSSTRWASSLGAEQRGTAADMFRRMYWDTALAASDPVLGVLQAVARIDQVLYGTDFPYQRRHLAVNSKQEILQSSALNDVERRAILGGNTLRLFPRLLSVLASRDFASPRSPTKG